MRGRLKQKLQGPDGVLRWVWKHFQLEVGSIRVTDDDSVGYGGGLDVFDARISMSQQVSLEGARRAVAWSGINAFNGCGFDLVWASGRTWALLCEDALSRNLWVDALNLSIRSAGNETADIDVGSSRAGERQGSPLLPRALDRNQQPRPQHSPRGETGAGWRDPAAAASGRGHLGGALPPARPAPRVGEHSWSGDPLPVRADEHAAPPAREGTERLHHRHGRCVGGGDHSLRAEESGGARGAAAGERRRPSASLGLPREEWMPPRAHAFAGGVMASSDAEHLRPPHGEGVTADKGTAPRIGTGQRGRCSSDALETGNDTVLSPADLASPRCGGDGDGGGGGSSTDRSVSSGAGGARRSRASQRSEELARASAATWEQFQQLLERSRRSKDRFDKAMDGATAAPTADSAHGEVRGSAERCGPGAGLSQPGGSGRLGLHRTPTTGPAAAAAASTVAAFAVQHETMAVSAGGSSTERVSNATTPRSCAESGAGDAPRTARRCGFEAVRQDVGGSLSANAGGHEDSRLSAGVTDVETSLLLEDGHAEGSAGEVCFDRGNRPTKCSSSGSSSRNSSSSAGDSVCGIPTGEENRRRRRRRSRPAPPPPPVSKPFAPSAHRENAVEVKGESVHAATATALSRRVQRLEANLEAARRRAEAAAQTELSLRRQLAAAAAAAAAGHDIDSAESRRLKDELADAKAALAEQQERGTETAAARALLEREGERQRTAAAEAQSRGEARLAEVLAEAAKAERGRAEHARQTQELEQALASEIGERRRLSSLLDGRSRSEGASRQSEGVPATAADGDLKARLASTRSELEAVSLERDSLAEELDQCITRLGDQAREVASALRSRQQREIAEISSRCEVEKEALREKLVLEAEERAREDIGSAVAAQERRIRAEAAAKAAKDAEQRNKQVREAREEAEEAGEATRKDIEKLRRLHARRVKCLEALLKEEGENLADARREIAACKATLAGDAGEFQRWTEEQRDQSTRLLKELAVIQRKVDKAVSAEAEARDREGLAMGRLRKVMEEARLERAEGGEVKRQLREALAELESDRSSQARLTRSNLQLKRAAEIAQQEVAMVEAERSRWHQERLSMETALERLTRLVYGTANGGGISRSNKSSSSSSNNNNNNHNNRANTTAAPTGGTGKHTPVSPWKPPGGARVVTAGGGRGHATGGGCSGGDMRAACSPIGVNAL